MPDVKYQGRTLKLDEKGYLVDYHDWDESVAGLLAEREGIGELSPDQIDILKFMRKFYEEHKFFPIVRAICKNVHQPKECVTEKFIDPIKAWKIAGLPNPGDEADMVRDWNQLTPD
jgi:TusE/DsrC/DsvC family sulfur relay protein